MLKHERRFIILFYLIDIYRIDYEKKEGRGSKRCSMLYLVKTLISRINDACGDHITWIKWWLHDDASSEHIYFCCPLAVKKKIVFCIWIFHFFVFFAILKRQIFDIQHIFLVKITKNIEKTLLSWPITQCNWCGSNT